MPDTSPNRLPDDVPDDAPSADPVAAARALQHYEEKAQALLDAYSTGTPAALERHYRLTWHRRAWSAMRTYVQLDLGKRPATPGGDVEISLDDARYLVAIEHGFESWDALVRGVTRQSSNLAAADRPVRVLTTDDHEAKPQLASRDWQAIQRALAEHPGATLDAHGTMTDEVLDRITRIEHVASLRLGGSRALTDGGVRHLARLRGLRALDLSQTQVTDRGLAVLGELPSLERLSLAGTHVTDAGIASLARCRELRQLNLMWTATGDGAIRELQRMEALTHFWSGNTVTDAGLPLLAGVRAFTTWRSDASSMALLRPDDSPNALTLRGQFTDRGMDALRSLEGLHALDLDDSALKLSHAAMLPLTALPHLARLSVDAKDDWMPHLARMPALRFLSAQDTTAGDDGFVALSRSHTIEFIWGRRCHQLRSRGFRALGEMSSLRGLSVSCLNVDDDALSTLPSFPALRELMPMDVPDAGYRHIGRCTRLEALLLMYCRDTTDAATEQIVSLQALRRYFNSYTTITDRTPELLSTMDSLEEVTFDACHGISNAGIAMLARLPRLRELRVAGRGLSPDVTKHFPSRITVHYSS